MLLGPYLAADGLQAEREPQLPKRVGQRLPSRGPQAPSRPAREVVGARKQVHHLEEFLVLALLWRDGRGAPGLQQRPGLRGHFLVAEVDAPVTAATVDRSHVAQDPDAGAVRQTPGAHGAGVQEPVLERLQLGPDQRPPVGAWGSGGAGSFRIHPSR